MTGGEYICTTVFKITRIPSKSILKEIAPENAVKQYKKEFARMLTELYQHASMKLKTITNISIEFTWISHSVENQTYQADIDLYFILRTITSTKSDSQEIDRSNSTLVTNTLSLLKYEYIEIEPENYFKIVRQSHQSCKALVKHENLDPSGIPSIDAIYTFDHIPDTEADFSNLINFLSNTPGLIIHFQLIPDLFSESELTFLRDYLQNANIASKGLTVRGVGQISFFQAENIQSTFQPYYNQRAGPLYLFNIVMRGHVNEVDSLASQVGGLLNSDPDNPVVFDYVQLNDEIFKNHALYFSPWIASDKIWENMMKNAHLDTVHGSVNPVFRRFSRILTVSEATEFFRLPIGSDMVSSGLDINESDRTSHKFTEKVIDYENISLGLLRSSENRVIGLDIDDLSKHMFICGTPGSGKTSFSIGLLDRLWNKNKIPFIVIEPAKNEYRAMIDSIPDIQIFTPGKEFISPFVLNPFYPPNNVKLSSYKSTLKTAFSAAVSMTTPLDRIFEEAVNNCYSDHGWSDFYTNNDGGATFNITEFIQSFHNTFADIGYIGEANNIGRAGEVRLKGMSNLFDYYNSIPIEDILNKPTIIELAAVENPEEKSLFIALILLTILSYVNSNYIGDGKLKNVVLLEEAHVLLDQNDAGNKDANSSQIAQNLVKRMLAESRSYGLGMIIADQSPRKVGLDIVALTDIKMTFRIVERTDREIVADSMGMDESQFQRLVKLRPGEAFTFFNRLDAPEEIYMSDYRANNGMRICISDEELCKNIHYWIDRPALTRPYPECEINNCCREGCSYECRSLSKDISRRIFNKKIKFTHDKEILRDVVHQLTALIDKELGENTQSEQLQVCVRVQFWRRVKYSSKYNISQDFKNHMIIYKKRT
ncbi:ATP-binding protein [Candidatus Methanomassiliicoccus intestinalis]|uniref:ATP-binding protein n=1 Tax=Candidatus Methanomassiliicoccus intestinalis TaxID=1406512 RepID=UPI0037DD0ACB